MHIIQDVNFGEMASQYFYPALMKVCNICGAVLACNQSLAVLYTLPIDLIGARTSLYKLFELPN